MCILCSTSSIVSRLFRSRERTRPIVSSVVDVAWRPALSSLLTIVLPLLCWKSLIHLQATKSWMYRTLLFSDSNEQWLSQVYSAERSEAKIGHKLSKGCHQLVFGFLEAVQLTWRRLKPKPFCHKQYNSCMRLTALIFFCTRFKISLISPLD